MLEQYRQDKRRSIRPPLDHDELAAVEETGPPDWDALLAAVKGVRPGHAQAGAYHKAIERLLTPLFYPSLSFPVIEQEIHEGRKRIDIVYTNSAGEGFFAWVGDHYGAPFIFVECKNYAGDPTNPELDQLSVGSRRDEGASAFLCVDALLTRSCSCNDAEIRPRMTVDS